MTKRMTATLALVLGGSLAAGIALARPASEPIAQAETQINTPAATAPDTPRQGYLGQTGGNPTGDQAPSPTAPTTATIEIRDFAFGATQTVSPGASITVNNVDSAPHTLTFDSGFVDTGTLQSGQSAAFSAPSEPGTYQFFCTIHPSMRGELVVQG